MEDQDNLKQFEDFYSNLLNDVHSKDDAFGDENTYKNNSSTNKKTMNHDLLSDLEAQIMKLQHSLEAWREIIIPIRSVLLWEKNWYPGAIIGGVTFLFLSLWLLDPSVLTTVSILGLTITISDYIVPMLTAALFKPELWNEEKDKELYYFCRGIVLYKAKISLSCASFYIMRSNRPKMYYGCTILTLVFLAWIGNSFNNLFLTYILVTLVLLIPGMEYHGILHKYGNIITQKISECTKMKIAQPKKEQ